MSLSQEIKAIKSDRIIFFVVLAIIVTRIFNGIVMAPIQDEMYYFYWSRFLDWGYFDHPPLVAWTSVLNNYFPSTAWAARFGTLVLGTLSIPLMASFFREVGLKDKAPYGAALLLASGSLVGILFGYLTTPDIPMIFCWIAALHECAKALSDQPKRWLSAGLFTGLGIIGKYTMVLIGPVFLLALIFQPRRLKSPWPYLGGLVCVLVMAPHILWLSQNEWITTRFQFGRGLMSQYGIQMQIGHDLPMASPALDSSKAARLASHFVLPGDKRKESKPKAQGLKKALQGAGDYLGGQMALWGLLLFPILYGLYRGLRKGHFKAPVWTWSSPAHGALVTAAALFPILIFLPLSTVQHIEANWPAMACIGLSALLVRYMQISRRLLAIGVAINIVATLILSVHTLSPLGFSKPEKDRVLRETSGYQDLAEVLRELPSAPLFADTYQNVSAMKFYAPELKIEQWPGIARTSEIQRRKAMNPWQWKDVESEGGFFLLTDNFIPPYIPGTEIESLSELMDCPNLGVVLTKASLESLYQRPCENKVHRWSLAYYAVKPSTDLR